MPCSTRSRNAACTNGGAWKSMSATQNGRMSRSWYLDHLVLPVPRRSMTLSNSFMSAVVIGYWSGTVDVAYNRPRLRLRGKAYVDVLDTIREQIQSNPIILYMKGSPQAPQCGFSAQTVQCLMACGERFAYVDVLSNPEVRANLPGFANWPTFPQLWVNGELVGGCDIVTEMFQSGELKTLIAEAAARAKAAS